MDIEEYMEKHERELNTTLVETSCCTTPHFDEGRRHKDSTIIEGLVIRECGGYGGITNIEYPNSLCENAQEAWAHLIRMLACPDVRKPDFYSQFSPGYRVLCVFLKDCLSQEEVTSLIKQNVPQSKLAFCNIRFLTNARGKSLFLDVADVASYLNEQHRIGRGTSWWPDVVAIVPPKGGGETDFDVSKFSWMAGDNLTAVITMNNSSPEEFDGGPLSWKIISQRKDEDGNLVPSMIRTTPEDYGPKEYFWNYDGLVSLGNPDIPISRDEIHVCKRDFKIRGAEYVSLNAFDVALPSKAYCQDPSEIMAQTLVERGRSTDISCTPPLYEEGYQAWAMVLACMSEKRSSCELPTYSYKYPFLKDRGVLPLWNEKKPYPKGPVYCSSQHILLFFWEGSIDYSEVADLLERNHANLDNFRFILTDWTSEGGGYGDMFDFEELSAAWPIDIVAIAPPKVDTLKSPWPEIRKRHLPSYDDPLPAVIGMNIGGNAYYEIGTLADEREMLRGPDWEWTINRHRKSTNGENVSSMVLTRFPHEDALGPKSIKREISIARSRPDWNFERDTQLPQYNCIDNKKALFENQNGYCLACEKQFPIDKLEVDHNIPLKKGGTDNFSNLNLLCAPCNRGKGIHSLEYQRKRLADEAKALKERTPPWVKKDVSEKVSVSPGQYWTDLISKVAKDTDMTPNQVVEGMIASLKQIVSKQAGGNSND